MAQPADAGVTATPQPRAHAIHLRPRPWRRRKDLEPNERAPYPFWFTIIARGVLAGLEGAAAGYIAWYHNGKESDGDSSPAEFALAGVVTAVVFDGLIALAAIAGVYRASGACYATVLDIIPGALSVVGGVNVTWRERGPDYDPWYEAQQTVGTLAVVVGCVHFAASIGGCVGCCIVGSRAKKSKKSRCATTLENGETINAPSATALADLTPKVSADGTDKAQLAAAEERVLPVEPPQASHGRRASSPVGTADKV